MMAVMNRFDKLFANPLPSFHPRDLLIGVAGGIALRLVVYYKAKNAKKFRQGVEYAFARWGNAKDIEPYMDSVFENNVLLTQTEQLMMSGRPKEPKYARNKNQKIKQVTESTLVLGVDIGSSEHYVRAFDYRGRELTRKVFRFSTDINGFNSFYDWVTQICIKHGKNEAMIGCEPTGHYWYTFYQFVKDHGMKLAFVNPASVKKAKELDDNSPKKTDLKDPKTIAKLVIDGRYSFPYVPEGIYAEIREVTSSRDRIMKELNAASNRIQRWLKIYFPEYLTVYKKFDTTTGMMILEEVSLPTMVTALGVDNIIKICREHKVRGKGASFNRAKTLVDAAHDSIGKSEGQGAVMEIQMLLEDYKVKKQQLEMVTSVMEELIMQIPNAEKMLSVDGVGLVTVAGFISEVGDISRITKQ